MRHRGRRERWLHARISEDLEDALKREARRRRSPVSLVVRNVLEGALDLVEDIVEDSFHLADRSRRFARPMGWATRERGDAPEGDTPEANADIYGWEQLILNRPATCARCDATLPVGANAYRGLRDRPGPNVFMCARCVERLRSAARQPKEAS